MDNTHTDEDLENDLKALSDGQDLTWRDVRSGVYDKKEPGTILWWLATQHEPLAPGTNLPQTACVKNVDVHQAYIFHITHWTNFGVATAPPTLLSSAWYVYRRPRHPSWEKKKPAKTNNLVKADLTGAGDPLIYGASDALIVGIDRFDPTSTTVDGKLISTPSPGILATTYSVTVTQGTPENPHEPRGTSLGSRRPIGYEDCSVRRHGRAATLYICCSCLPTGNQEVAVRYVDNQRSREKS